MVPLRQRGVGAVDQPNRQQSPCELVSAVQWPENVEQPGVDRPAQRRDTFAVDLQMRISDQRRSPCSSTSVILNSPSPPIVPSSS
jgi:hypothetical protein